MFLRAIDITAVVMIIVNIIVFSVLFILVMLNDESITIREAKYRPISWEKRGVMAVPIIIVVVSLVCFLIGLNPARKEEEIPDI